jgi:hypothetical protein
MIADARGGPLDRDGVVRALCAVSALAADDRITAIDLNPVVVSRDRAVAVDAALTTRDSGGDQA